MATRCPKCGKDVPSEAGQHAPDLVGATLDCPHCGASANLRQDAGGGDVARSQAAPPGRTEDEESFAGNETISEVVEELRDK